MPRVCSSLAGLIAGALFSVAGCLAAAEQPAPAAELQPAFTAFPGFWFDYLPDVVSAENGWELKLRVGLADVAGVQVDFLDARQKILSSLNLSNSTSAEDFTHGRLAVLTVPVAATPELAWIRLRPRRSEAGSPPRPADAAAECQIEIRTATAATGDLRLAVLPPGQRIGAAEHLVAQAAGIGTKPVLPWAALGARLTGTDGHPIVLRHAPRQPQPDRSGLVTGIFRPRVEPAKNATRTLIVAPASLQSRLQPLATAGRFHATAVTTAFAAPPAQPPAAPSVVTPEATPFTQVVLAPAVTSEHPFHPVVGVLTATLAALEQPNAASVDRLIVILPWDDAQYGTDPREFALALDAVAEHFRAQTRAGDRALHELIVLGPFRHPSVPEKRHTMLESQVAERQRAQGFLWPDLPDLSNPARWRQNAAADPVAVYADVPNDAGCARLVDRLREWVTQP